MNMVLIPAVYSGKSKGHESYTKQGLVMIYESLSPTIDEALNVALSHAMKKQQKLTIILDTAESGHHVEQLVSSFNMPVAVEIADISKTQELILLLYRLAPGLLVLTETGQLVSDEKILDQMINSLESDLLLVS